MTREELMKVFSRPSMQEALKMMPPIKVVSCQTEGGRAVLTVEGTGFQEGVTSRASIVLEDGQLKID